MKKLLLPFFLIGILLAAALAPAQPALPDLETLRTWIQEMKQSPRGPFQRIRWFCNDGTIHPPNPYPCGDRGGGRQHGEWSDRTKILRAQGYYIANVLADIDPRDFVSQQNYEEILKQIILEQFLVSADDGWILREARYYRGALQAEGEEKNGKRILLALLEDPRWSDALFPVLREAVRFLPHGRKGAPFTEMRQLARTIAEKDIGFEPLRTKIHVKPDAGDAERVRAYAAQEGNAEILEEYRKLAATIDEVYRPEEMGPEILLLADRLKNTGAAVDLRRNASLLSGKGDFSARLDAAGQLLAALRENLTLSGDPGRMLALLDESLWLEHEALTCGKELLENLPGSSRRERLSWLQSISASLYGIGLISGRQWGALKESFARLNTTPLFLRGYKQELDYFSLVPRWAQRCLGFHFSETMDHLSAIEPLASYYVHDRLRGSPLILFTAVLDSLMEDADRLLGIRHELFGTTLNGGLSGLNPGLARGALRLLRRGQNQPKHDNRGIYVLPATTADLPPVAGMITAGMGNSLSHVNLLARNLGIPNAAVDEKLLPRLAAKEGQRVVLAVSPGGVVQLQEDNPGWDEVFRREKTPRDNFIQPDLEKLDIENREFIPLNKLRASDSGRIAGPKAANLGELKHHYPEAVTDGLVIPFGVFRALLDQPVEPGGPSVFHWMRDEYARLRSLEGKPHLQERETSDFLKRMRDWIINADPGAGFREGLREAMARTFGADGTYGVFVRSDTNVEDLPAFTGAGLNLTVPNVVGFQNVLDAVARVWASPFTDRAYGWRQSHMVHPEHVYVSVLLMKSVPSEKSGVMVTADLESGLPGWLSVAVN